MLVFASGAAVLLISSLWRVQETRVRAFGYLIVGLPLTLAGTVSILAERGASAEAATSTVYRLAVFADAVRLVAKRPLDGVGPGSSELVKSGAGGATGSLSLENGWLEIAVSAGLVFTGIIVGCVCVLVFRAIRRRNGEVLALLVALVMDLASSNSFEGNRPSLIKLTAILWICLWRLSRGVDDSWWPGDVSGSTRGDGQCAGLLESAEERRALT
jgi:O-antigen ligase